MIAVDISPVESPSSLNFPNYVAAMRAVDIPDEASLSSARKLVDEKLSCVIQVIHPSPCMVLWAKEEWRPRASQGVPPTRNCWTPTEHKYAAVPAHQPGGGGRALYVEGELGCLGPALGQDLELPTTTRNLLWAIPLPPGWKLSIRAVSQAGWGEGHT